MVPPAADVPALKTSAKRCRPPKATLAGAGETKTRRSTLPVKSTGAAGPAASTMRCASPSCARTKFCTSAIWDERSSRDVSRPTECVTRRSPSSSIPLMSARMRIEINISTRVKPSSRLRITGSGPRRQCETQCNEVDAALVDSLAPTHPHLDLVGYGVGPCFRRLQLGALGDADFPFIAANAIERLARAYRHGRNCIERRLTDQDRVAIRPRRAFRAQVAR